MVYEPALESDALSPAARTLPPETLLAVGEVAERLLGAASTAYTGAKAEAAAHIIALEINYLLGLGVIDDVSALVIASETRGARSLSYHGGLALVPPGYQEMFDDLDETPVTTATPASDPARFATLRSRR
jgi:hypothetical protein